MRWLEGLGGQNREEGQGVYAALGAQLLSKGSTKLIKQSAECLARRSE